MPAALAEGAVGIHGDVPYLRRKAMGTLVKRTVDNDAAAYAGADGHVQQVCDALTRSKPVLR